MKCLYTRALLWWDTAGSRARAAAHARQCPECAIQVQTRDSLRKTLQNNAGGLLVLPAEVTARVMRQTRRMEGRTSNSSSPLSTWGIRLAGVATLLLIAGGTWIVMHPSANPASPTPLATRDIDAAKFARDVNGGLDQISAALSRTTKLVPWQRAENSLAMASNLANGRWAPVATAEASESPMKSLADRLDPLGVTDSRQREKIRRFGRTTGLW